MKRRRLLRTRSASAAFTTASLACLYLPGISTSVDAFDAGFCRPSPATFTSPRNLQYRPYPAVLALSSTSKSNSPSQHGDDEEEEGSILGASLLFAGTAIGAGMLALPAETLYAGFIPSISGLTLCWVFTYVTSIATLEASWISEKLSSSSTNEGGQEGGGGERGGGFLSISRSALGLPGEIVTGVLFWFLLTSIVVAYTAEGGQLISQFVHEISSGNIHLAPAIGSGIFASCFGSIAIYGTSRVDSVNRIFVLGLVGTFVGLVGFGLPQIDTNNLINRADWSAIYPTVLSIGILSFGAQNVVPTLLQYLGNDPNRTRRAILFGSLTPLVMYTIWEAVFLGIVSADAAADGGESKMQIITVLGETGGTVVKDLVQVFSACAIGSSMAGASVSLVDFCDDIVAIATRSKSRRDDATLSNAGSRRLLAAALALGPPVFLSYAFPDIFLVALEEAGLLGGVSLYGILPALCILSLRGSAASANITMPGRLGGGDVALCALVAISSGLVLPEIIRLTAPMLK